MEHAESICRLPAQVSGLPIPAGCTVLFGRHCCNPLFRPGQVPDCICVESLHHVNLPHS
jgi:hypothetical protein